MKRKINHYDYLEAVLPEFFKALGISWENNCGIISAHGDKGGFYRHGFEKAGLSYGQGMAIYLLTYVEPYASECRDTPNGWVPPNEWVIQNAHRFLHLLPIEEK